MTTTTPNIATSPDEALVAACAAGDRSAFRPLVERYQSLVCSIAYAIVGDLKRSEEVAQEAFLAAWRGLSTLTEPAKFKSWLSGITRNLSHHAIRNQHRTVELNAAAAEPSDKPGPVDQAITREEEAIVWNALEGLDETYREPLVLFYREGQSVTAVAEALGISGDAVKQRLSRGRERVKEQIAQRIEAALRRSRPGTGFTMAVLAALPAVVAGSATTAKAATATGAAAMAKAAITTGASGALIGIAGGLAGAGLGGWAAYNSARYQRQRVLLRRNLKIFAAIILLFMAPMIAMAVGWWPRTIHPGNYIAFYMLWMFSFFLAIGLWAWQLGRASRKIAAQEIAAGAPELPRTPLQRWLSSWEGRQYQSRLTLLGLPLVHIHFGNPDRTQDASPGQPVAKLKVARGWIAIGERAYGVLFAMGNIAVGAVAIGAFSVGLLSIGGLAAGGAVIGGLVFGIVPFGGLSLGIWALGGLACGIYAFGGAAFAWQCARGGFAAAVRYADAGNSPAAYAQHANDAAARAAADGNPFFQLAQHYVLPVLSTRWFSITFVALSILMPVSLCLIGYRRKRPS